MKCGLSVGHECHWPGTQHCHCCKSSPDRGKSASLNDHRPVQVFETSTPPAGCRCRWERRPERPSPWLQHPASAAPAAADRLGMLPPSHALRQGHTQRFAVVTAPQVRLHSAHHAAALPALSVPSTSDPRLIALSLYRTQRAYAADPVDLTIQIAVPVHVSTH